MKIKISYTDPKFKDIPPPSYATSGSAGLDLFAAVEENIIIRPNQTCLIPTGIRIELPEGYEAQVRPRSGLAINYGIGILNSPGTIDSDYRGEIKVIIHNFGDREFEIKRGDRIAQMIINKYERVDLEIVEDITDTKRGSGGFGHTGR
ncbi:MAG: Deoxyuridine 5'-triphosphate nucleotidohydrolase [Ignavibacteriae bacterium]|nr:MAG: Deoxyuridine 5'-triphosphate nucleotidohydrolase [Ignavibacteriota bacterium]